MGDLCLGIKVEWFTLPRGHLVDLILNAGREDLYLGDRRELLGCHDQQPDGARDAREQA
ncbi:hypothetical protein [Microtetraspora malaysiensis]|uniref:hypothetical protein n=1 Tax=Microtetraspora malaysiensis TaxID=161358 RepID=UPI001FE1B5F2|nr:hypothetical protein [Microtetraspora malaysiensis]